MAIAVSAGSFNDQAASDVAVAPEDTLGETAAKLAEAGATAALVLDFGRPIGTLSLADLLRASAARVHPSEGRVREWMSGPIPKPTHDGSIRPSVIRRTWPALPDEVAGLLCELQYAAGRIENCPGASCLYWGGEGCMLTPVKSELGKNPTLASFLVGLRTRITRTGSSMFGLLPGLD